MTPARIISYCLIFLVMLCADGIWWRCADRRLRALPRAALWRSLLGVWVGLMVVYLLLLCAVPSAVRRVDTPVPTAFHAAVFLWHLFVLPVLIVVELFACTTRTLEKMLTRKPVAVPMASAGVQPTRRQLLGGVAMAMPALATGALVSRAMRQIKSPPRVRRMEISLAQLPPQMDGMTIAHVTDTHVGKFTEPGMLLALADQVNSLRCDFVVVTGDLIDMSLSDLPATLDMVNRLDPRNGIIVCEGNHDLFESRHRFENRTRAAGVPLLVDESCLIDFRGSPVQFLGLKWEEGPESQFAENIATLRPQISPDAFPILLAHHPHAFDPAAEAGIPLTLSGHTHGGQIMFTDRIGGGPASFRYWSGLYRKPGSALVVSNGVGSWFPLRINAPAEIIQLTLRSQG